MIEKTCCVTGHRHLPAWEVARVTDALHAEVRRAASEGFTHFISGFADGVDLMFAQAVLDVRGEYPDISLVAAIPHAERLSHRNLLFQRLLAGCAQVEVVSETYDAQCYARRNRFMVDRSARVLAVHDGLPYGGTAQTVRYAMGLKKDVLILRVAQRSKPLKSFRRGNGG